MAKVIFGNGVSKISGRIGGNVYSRNRGGYYVKGYGTPAIPSSGAQAFIQFRFGPVAANWKLITDAQRRQWASYARTHPVQDRMGQRMILSGYAMYVRINFQRSLTNGGPFSNDPPSDGVWADKVLQINRSDALELHTGSANIWIDTGATLGMKLMVYITPPMTTGTNFYGGKMTRMNLVTLTAPNITAQNFSIYSNLLSRYGLPNLTVGQKFACRVRQWQDGVLGPAWQLTGIVD